jgi:hypothetical protein
MARWLGLALVVMLLVAGVAPGTWSQPPGVDPQGLVGTWSGSWNGAHQSKRSGRYHLTIERVEGEKVYGTEEITGRSQSTITVRGRLSGNTLTYGKTSLTIDGDEMRGNGPDFKITLTKEK